MAGNRSIFQQKVCKNYMVGPPEGVISGIRLVMGQPRGGY